MPGEKPTEASLDWKPNGHIQRRDRESNPDSVVHSAEEVPLRYLLPQPIRNFVTRLVVLMGCGTVDNGVSESIVIENTSK